MNRIYYHLVCLIATQLALIFNQRGNREEFLIFIMTTKICHIELENHQEGSCSDFFNQTGRKLPASIKLFPNFKSLCETLFVWNPAG